MNKLRQLRARTERFLSRIRAHIVICRIRISPIASIPMYARYSVLSGATNAPIAVKQIALNTILGEKNIKFDNCQ